jgi:hypothetical protein
MQKHLNLYVGLVLVGSLLSGCATTSPHDLPRLHMSGYELPMSKNQILATNGEVREIVQVKEISEERVEQFVDPVTGFSKNMGLYFRIITLESPTKGDIRIKSLSDYSPSWGASSLRIGEKVFLIASETKADDAGKLFGIQFLGKIDMKKGLVNSTRGIDFQGISIDEVLATKR